MQFKKSLEQQDVCSKFDHVFVSFCFDHVLFNEIMELFAVYFEIVRVFFFFYF